MCIHSKGKSFFIDDGASEVVRWPRNLQNDNRSAAQPDKKKGRIKLTTDLLETANEFYLSEGISQVMPGVEDVKSVVADGKRHKKTVSNHDK